MFASALQKRKAVVLSQTQSQTQPLRQQTQLQAPQLAPPRANAPVARNPVGTTGTTSVGAIASTAASVHDNQHGSISNTSAGRSLSEMLSKRQKTETPQELTASSQSKSGFTTAREWAGAERTQPKATAAKARTSPAKAKSRAASTSARKVRQQSSEQSEEGVVFELSNKRRVTVRKWRAAVLIDIREYYDDDGVSKPGKKGISLSQDQWRSLQRLTHAIDEAIILVEDDNVDEHSLQDVPERIAADSKERTITFILSSKRRISVRFFRTAVLVDLREFYDDGGVSKPGKKGIALSKDQWRVLCASQREVSEAASQL